MHSQEGGHLVGVKRLKSVPHLHLVMLHLGRTQAADWLLQTPLGLVPPPKSPPPPPPSPQKHFEGREMVLCWFFFYSHIAGNS